MHHDPAMVGKPKYDRIENDAYDTPPWCVDVLLRYWWPDGPVWEPMAGKGNIVNALKQNNIDAFGSDIEPRSDDVTKHDFFDYDPLDFGSIVTNPPYIGGTIERTIDRCMMLRMPFALFLRNEWDCAASRSAFWHNNASAYMKVVLTKRPVFFAGGPSGPRHNFAWYIWDERYATIGTPVIRYGKCYGKQGSLQAVLD